MTIESPAASGAGHVDEAQVRDILRQVIDPELGMNIVALGLIYRIELSADHVTIEMTMTSPACPMGEMIVGDIDAALTRALSAACRHDVRLVWEPPWNPGLMSEAAKLELGFL